MISGQLSVVRKEAVRFQLGAFSTIAAGWAAVDVAEVKRGVFNGQYLDAVMAEMKAKTDG